MFQSLALVRNENLPIDLRVFFPPNAGGMEYIIILEQFQQLVEEIPMGRTGCLCLNYLASSMVNPHA